ncbi:MAG: hypothetical protein ABFD89_00870 [Bryobacteraceae bacterium]
MGRSVSTIQADIDAVHAEAAKAESSAHIGDRGFTRRDEAQRQKALAALESEMAAACAATSSTRAVRQIRLFSNKGL